MEKKENKIEEKKSKSKKKEVAVKEAKKVSAKKLPPMFKKAYSSKKLEKKVLSKLYIEQDKALVQKLFVPAKDSKGRDVVKVDLSQDLLATEVFRCKELAKQIKMNKGGIKVVPLLAVIILCVAIGVVVSLFKNVIVRNAVTSSMEGIFGAKTDLEKVNVEIFKADLRLGGLAQANKENPMKNLFEIESIKLDFNLTELLKGKFHAENLVVTGVALDTDRKTSGELPVKEKKNKEQKQIDFRQTKLAQGAEKALQEMFENYNPEKLLSNLQNELKSPEVAISIGEEVTKMTAKYQSLPKELETSVTTFSSSVNSVVTTDWTKINDATKLKTTLETINKALSEGENLKKKLNDSSKGLQADVESVKGYSTELSQAIKSDTALVESKVAEMKKLFSIDGLKGVMNDAIQSVMYSVCGQYYPYVEKALGFAENVKSKVPEKSASEEKPKKEKKAKTKITTGKRAEGRNVYYKKDRVPKFLIENAVASGYEYGKEQVESNLLFKGTGSQISSDQNVRGEPTKIDAVFKINGNNNNANLVIDSRKDSSEPLILANYSGNGFPINADAKVFNFNSQSGIAAKLVVTGDGGFTVGGTIDMAISEMKGMDFEPARVCTLYKNALGGIKKLTIGFTIGMDDEKNVVVKIENPEKLANQLVTPIANALTGEITSLASDAKKNVTRMLDEKTGGAASSISSFLQIEGDVNNQKKALDNLNAKLEAKKKEISNQITNSAKSATVNALKDMANSDTSASSAATNAASNFLKGLKK